MSSNITINISAQSGDEDMKAKKRESADNIPAPPVAKDEAISKGSQDTSHTGVPAPPQDAISEGDLVSDQPAAPPKFMGETSDSSAGGAGIAPAPPSDHPDISEEDNKSQKKSSGAPPPADDDNDKKGKSDNKKKKK